MTDDETREPEPEAEPDAEPAQQEQAEADTEKRETMATPADQSSLIFAARDGLISRLINLLAQVNLGEIPGLITAVNAYREIELSLATEEGVKARIDAAARIATEFVDVTRTEWDDQIVEQLNQLLAKPGLRDLIASIVSRLLRGPETAFTHAAVTQAVGNVSSGGDDATYQAQGVAWTDLVGLIQIVLAIIKSLG